MAGTERKPGSRRKAPTLAEMVRELFIRQEERERQHSSVTIARSVKGVISFEVSVRTGESGGVQTVDQAVRKAQAIVEKLNEAYPMADAGGAAGAGE